MSISWYLYRSESCVSGDYVFIFSVSIIHLIGFKEPLINYVMSLAQAAPQSRRNFDSMRPPGEKLYQK